MENKDMLKQITEYGERYYIDNYDDVLLLENMAKAIRMKFLLNNGKKLNERIVFTVVEILNQAEKDGRVIVNPARGRHNFEFMTDLQSQ